MSALVVLQAFIAGDRVKSSNQFFLFSDEGTARLEMIASTEIVSENYNPECNMTFGAGWFDLIKAVPSEEQRLTLWLILQQPVRRQGPDCSNGEIWYDKCQGLQQCTNMFVVCVRYCCLA